MSDEFAVIGRGENGNPHVRYCLDPREVTVIRDPEQEGVIIGYIWEPVGPVSTPIRTDPWSNPRLIERPEPHPTRWVLVMYAGMAIAAIAVVWLTAALIFASSPALTLPTSLGLLGALVSGVGVFGPVWERRRRRRESR